MSADAFRVGLLLVLAACALVLAFQLPSDIFFDFGPNDARYTRGFREDFEVDEPTIIHWSSDRSTVTLPFRLSGPYDVTLRYKRHIASPAEVRFFLGDERVETATVPQRDFGLIDLHTDNTDGGPFELRLLSRSDDPRPLGLALDWMQIRPSPQFGAVVPNARALLWMLSWVAAFYIVPRLIGLGFKVASVSSALAACALVVLTGFHKLWPVHASSTLGMRTHVIAALLVLFFLLRQRVQGSAFATSRARWAVYLVYLGLAIRLFALFHPDFYYPDVRTHSKFVSLIWTEGLDGFFANYIENQHTHLLGLQLVGNHWLAFPYPPLLYLTIYPLSLLELPVEDWMKLVPAALLAVEALILFALAQKLGLTGNAAVFVVLLHATARGLAFRLAVASYAALFGHFWDTVVVLYLVFFFDRIERPLYAMGFALLIAVSILSYAGSALVLGMLVPAFCLAFVFVRKDRRPESKRLVAIAAWALAGALAAVFSFYWQYIPEILARPEAAGSRSELVSELVDVTFTPTCRASDDGAPTESLLWVFGVPRSRMPLLRTGQAHPLARRAAGGCGDRDFRGVEFLASRFGDDSHLSVFEGRPRHPSRHRVRARVAPRRLVSSQHDRAGRNRGDLDRLDRVGCGGAFARYSQPVHPARIPTARGQHRRVIRVEQIYDAYTTRLPPARFAL